MTYYKEPETPKVGDLWIKDGETYRWDGKRWVKLTTIDEIYDYADLIVGTLNRKNIAMFDQLKTLPKAQVIRKVTRVYEEIDTYTKSYYLILAKKVYKICADKLGLDYEDEITMLWVMAILEGYDPVTKYVYTHEVDRKRARLIEALMATDEPSVEVRTGLKQWTKQIKQYADNITAKVIEKVYLDNKIKEVMWLTERDERVCIECSLMDGKIYPIKKIPDKPHYGCRCYTIPIRGEDGKTI